MVKIEVQYALRDPSLPGEKDFSKWAAAVESKIHATDEVALRVVGQQEITRLNERYRKKSQPTNVLSFPADLPAQITLSFLGDIIICAPMVVKEADQQHKTHASHWAHMAVHGILHLQGYDHGNDQEAAEMENLEIEILNRLGFANPYVQDGL